MPINAYTGLMGSGKSYEVVSEVILPQIDKGRHVVTNVDGLSRERAIVLLSRRRAMRALGFLGRFAVAFGLRKLVVPEYPDESFGRVQLVTNEDCARPDFLPHGTNIRTIVPPGAIVVIDEAWRVWGSSVKFPDEHMVFFREHRHYVDPVTKISSDLTVMVQDINDLHRKIKAVIEVSFKTKKLKFLGSKTRYGLSVFEGCIQKPSTRVSTSVKRYNPKIFAVYSSYSGGHGVEKAIDGRQSVFAKGGVVAAIFLVPLVCVYSGIRAWAWAHPAPGDTVIAGHKFVPAPGVREAAQAGPVSSAVAAGLPRMQEGAAPPSSWRVAGTIQVSSGTWVVVQNRSGRLAYRDPSECEFHAGRVRSCKWDGVVANAWDSVSPVPAAPGSLALK